MGRCNKKKPQNALKVQLINKKVTSKLDNKEFVSDDCLKQLLTRENIMQELKRARVTSTDDLLAFILQKAKKVFVILVWLQITEAIEGFYNFKFTDGLLPIDCKSENNGYVVRSLSADQVIINNYREALSVFKAELDGDESEEDESEGDQSDQDDSGGDDSEGGDFSWNQGYVHDFCEAQWKFLAPVFTGDQYRYQLHPNTILPFSFKGEEKGGGFSKVFQIEIHPAHWHGINSHLRVALKEQRTDSQYASKQLVSKMYQQEGEVLEMIRKLNDRHLIEVFAAFERGDTSYFMFPWADGGNLREFWTRKTAGNSSSTITWVLSQLCGICNAISKLHNLDTDRNCRHGDLKPENILIFEEPPTPGRLVIADVGLARVHSQATPLRMEHTVTMSGTQRYEPPDVLNQIARSRVYDIWSMGCICLEFIVWLLWEYKGLHSFNERFPYQKFWEARQGANSSSEARIHREVEGLIRWLRDEDPRCGEHTALGDLLTLVEERLLVIKVKSAADSSNGSGQGFRAESREMAREMARIAERAVPGSNYLTACAQKPPNISFLNAARPKATVPRIGTQHLGVPGQAARPRQLNGNHPPQPEHDLGDEQGLQIIIGDEGEIPGLVVPEIQLMNSTQSSTATNKSIKDTKNEVRWQLN